MHKHLSIFIGLLISLLILTAPLSTLAQEPQTHQTTTHTITFTPDNLIITSINGYDAITIPDGDIYTNPGKPTIPTKTICIAIPATFKVTTLTTQVTTTTLPSTYILLPSQEPQPLSQQTTTMNHITPTYFTNREYPTTWAQLSHQSDLAGQNLAYITLYPIHYNPYTKTIQLATTITLTLTGTTDYTIQDYLPTNLAPTIKKLYQQQLTELVINPETITLKTAPYHTQTLGVPPGSYDYVIITPDSFENAWQTLATWKTQKGVPTAIINTTWIYTQGGYSGTNQQKIRAFIQDAHATWGASFYLLGADSDNIPYQIVVYDGDDIPSDTYYADYDSDWVCEVFVGRASVTNTGSGAGGITNFINKILTYEKNPPTTDYAKKIGLFGFDLDSSTDGEDCKIDINNDYIPAGWSVTTIYDSHTGNHEDNVDLTINSGQHFLNHIDHSGEYFMGTGYTNHNGMGLDTNEVDAFNNGNKQSIFYSIGCWANAFDYANCIAEHFVRDTDGGGVAFVGNTRYGWYYVGYDDLASLRYDRYFFRSLYNQNHYLLGDLFTDHKNDAYGSMTGNTLNKYIFSEITLLGDPELPLWTENPQTISVTHPTTLPMGSSSFTVQVTSGGSNLADATVCLWKGTEVYLRGTTNSAGQASFTPTPTSTGSMSVTVTKHNYLPYEGSATVLSSNQPPIADAGGPYTGTTGIPITLDGSGSYDPDGTIALYEWDFETDGIYDWNSTTTGITTHNYPIAGPYTATIRVTDNEGANDTDTASVTISDPPNNPPNIPSNPTPSDGAINVNFNADISWTGGDPDTGDTVTYDIYFGTTSTPPLIASSYPTTTYDPGTLSYSTTYYWYIIAEDNHGASTVGPLWEFTTEAPQNHPPNTPSDPYPAHQATNIPLTPTLTWTGGDPDTGDTVTYDVYFGTTNPPPKIIANQTTTDYTPGNLSLNTIYYWQIIAWDNHGETTPGIIWDFTTQTDTNLPPDIPLIGGYVRGRAGITYTYTFSCTDPDNDNFYLYVEWGDETTTEWIGPYPSGDEITLQHAWTNVGTYLIRAKAKDIHDAEGEWGHLSITMPLRNTYITSIFEHLIHNLCNWFPRLATLLNQLLY